MYTFQDLPGHSRTWVYQANRNFTEAEVAAIKQQAQEFLANWAAHGTPLKAAIDVLHSRFMVIMVDEAHAKATGCSIDKSVHFVKSVEQQLKVNLFNRLQVAYLDGDEIRSFQAAEMNDQIDAGQITDNTVIFNNTVTTKQEWETNWKIPVKNSWLAATLPA